MKAGLDVGLGAAMVDIVWGRLLRGVPAGGECIKRDEEVGGVCCSLANW